MSFTTANICVAILVLLSLRSCHSRPHSLSKRAVVKDYLNPSIFSPIEFEKEGNGKFYVKKNAYRKDSAVNYVEDEVVNAKDKKAVASEVAKAAVTLPAEETVPTTVVTSENFPLSPSNVQEVKSEENIPPKAETVRAEVSGKIEMAADKAPFTPIDTKLLVSSKPDSKDEIAEPTVLPPAEREEKVDIGEVPLDNSRIIPIPDTFRLPILIPIRQISFGTVSVLPLQPATASDRLPLPYDDEIVGEGGYEGDSSEDGSEENQESGLPLGDPYVPALPFTGSFLKDLKEAAAKQDAEKQTKIVDVLGKKFVMQSNVLKYPRGDLGHTYVRFMSIKPLEDADSKAEGEDVEAKSKESEIRKGIELEKEILDAKKSVDKVDAKEKETEKEPLEAEETETKQKTEAPMILPTDDDSFKQYEDPYLKGIEDIHKKHSFESMVPSVASNVEGEEKKMSTSEKTLADGKVISEEKIGKKSKGTDPSGKDVKKEKEIAFKESIPNLEKKQKELKNKDNGKIKEKIVKKRKCKCEDSSDDD